MNPSKVLRQFFQKNGTALGLFLLVAVAFWMFILIVLPQLFMVDFSLSKNLPPADLGGPKDVLTLEHYKFMIYGSTQEAGSYNTVDLSVFVRTLWGRRGFASTGASWFPSPSPASVPAAPWSSC